ATNDVHCDKLSKELKDSVEGQWTCKQVSDPKTSKNSNDSPSKTSSHSATMTDAASLTGGSASMGLVAAVLGALLI
ncbi:hypothetical protein KEM55_004847, partial [Ascosphaera atra]